jgi:hypothetical protein
VIASFDDEVLTFDVAKITEALSEALERWRSPGRE